MACTQNIAKLLSHIRACHTADLPGARLPFYVAGRQVGFLVPDFAMKLARLSPAVTVANGRVELAAANELNELARAAGILSRGEDFDVRESVAGETLAVLDRGALPAFGVIGAGAHLNGLVKRADGLCLWVGKRAADKKLDPGKLDHLVAGGIPAGLSPMETLIKEAAEEAGLPEDLAAQARPVGTFAYNMERAEGLRRDVIFVFDLLLPETFTPKPHDGEVEFFELWPIERVFSEVATTDNFKFNVNLVLIDLFIRKGLIEGDDARRLLRALAGDFS